MGQPGPVAFICDGGGRTAQVSAIAQMLNLESTSFVLYASPHHDYLSEAKLRDEVPGEKSFHFVRNPMMLNVGIMERCWLFVAGLIDAFRLVLGNSFSGFIGLGTYLCIPVFVFAKLKRIRCIFIESYTRIDDLSVSGRIVYWLRLADRFYVLHRELKQKYPRTVLVES
jgi:hypothetical protein